MTIGQDTNHMPCGVDRFRIYFAQHCRTLVSSSAGENRMELAFREMAKLTGESINIIYSIADGNMRPTNSVLRQMGWIIRRHQVPKPIEYEYQDFYEPAPQYTGRY